MSDQEPVWPPTPQGRGKRRHCARQGHRNKTALDQWGRWITACVECGQTLKVGR